MRIPHLGQDGFATSKDASLGKSKAMLASHANSMTHTVC